MHASAAMETRNIKRPKQEIGVESLHPVTNNNHALGMISPLSYLISSIVNFLWHAFFRLYYFFMQECAGILRSLRDVPPAHYSLKIESLSLFRNTTNENYESGAFEAGGYKW